MKKAKNIEVEKVQVVMHKTEEEIEKTGVDRRREVQKKREKRVKTVAEVEIQIEAK